MNEELYKTFCNEVKVAVEIVKMRHEGIIPYFNNVVERLSPYLTKNEVHSAVNCLIDMGGLNDNWEKVDTSWVRAYAVGRNSNLFFKMLCYEIYGEE